MRISEPTIYRMGDIHITGTGRNQTFSLDVCGKGNIEGESRNIVFGKEFVKILKKFRLELNRSFQDSKVWSTIDALPSYGETVPVIPDMTGMKPIKERQLSNIFKEISNLMVNECELILANFGGSREESDQLKRDKSKYAQMTCHYMRHTHATFFLSQTDDITATQERLGHADLSTTQIYLHVLDSTKKKTADKFNVQLLAENMKSS